MRVERTIGEKHDARLDPRPGGQARHLMTAMYVWLVAVTELLRCARTWPPAHAAIHQEYIL